MINQKFKHQGDQKTTIARKEGNVRVIWGFSELKNYLLTLTSTKNSRILSEGKPHCHHEFASDSSGVAMGVTLYTGQKHEETIQKFRYHPVGVSYYSPNNPATGCGQPKVKTRQSCN